MKRQIAAILTATVIPLVSCSGTPPTSPDIETTAPTAASTAATPTTTQQTTTAEPTSQTSAVGTSSSSTETSPADAPETDIYDDIPVGIPATITGADREAAEQAAAVWRAAMRIFDESLQNPTSHDWQPDVYEYVNDPAALTQVSLIGNFANQGFRQIGPTRFAAEVLSATGHNVQIRACLDLTQYDVVDADGDSVLRPDQQLRFSRTYGVSFYYDEDPEVWQLNNVVNPDPAEPC